MQAQNKQAAQTYQIGFVVLPRFNMMALTTTLEPLRVANYITTDELYAWSFLSPDGAAVTASNGMALETRSIDGMKAHRWDAVFICGSWNSETYDNPDLFAWLRRMDRKGVMLGSMDIGAYVLARAQLMSGYRATTHWYCVRAFAEQFPNTLVEEQLFVVDRTRMTSAGGTAGLDMMLHEIDRRHGRQLALEVADMILHYPVREPDAPQRQALGGKQKSLHPAVREAVSLMESNLEDHLTVPAIAEAVGVSQRKLERLFAKYMGCSVISFYQLLKLQFARVLLTNTAMSVREVSVACGFSSLSYFSKLFGLHFGKRPREYREAWPELEPAPIWPGTTISLIEAAKQSRSGRA